MAGGFGFTPPQAPRPNGQQVGSALMARGQMGQMAPPTAMPGVEMPMSSEQENAIMASSGRAMREAGAKKMGAAGQIDDAPIDDGAGHSPNALNIAVGEALTRMGGGYKTNPNPHKDRDRSMRQLMQLGLSETEAGLLVATGGV